MKWWGKTGRFVSGFCPMFLDVGRHHRLKANYFFCLIHMMHLAIKRTGTLRRDDKAYRKTVYTDAAAAHL